MSPRAQLNSDLQGLRSRIAKVIPILEPENSRWYGSVLIERRHKEEYKVNLKGKTKLDSIQVGAVLRIYDGHTMFEQATDSMDPVELERLAGVLVKQAESNAIRVGARKPYTPPSWKERLHDKLDPEISLQIPGGVNENSEVHFGVKSQSALWREESSAMAHAVDGLTKLKEYSSSLEPTDVARDPDFLQVSMVLNTEDFLFIDRSVNMSQTLLRNRMVLVAMKQGEYGLEIFGGIGGAETVIPTTENFAGLFVNLKKLLSAARLEPGRYKVLMGPEVTGVFAHEAFGHSQEGDTCARGRSKAWELYHSKESVGNEHATIMNNPAIFANGDLPYGAWGSYYFDEEGWIGEEQYLVREGVLQAPMTNLTSAIRLGVPRTANGKRECWSHGVYTRQTNTYFSAGKSTLKEMIAAVDYGFLAMSSAGGMEDPKGMGIQVGIQFLEEIKDGKLTGKIFRGPSGGAVQMTGYTPDYLNSILMKSKVDANKDGADTSKFPLNKVGGCGKYHKELVNAGCGGPYLLVDKVLLG